jgi:hypothetical protein
MHTDHLLSMPASTPASDLLHEGASALMGLTEAIFYTGLSGDCLRRYEKQGLIRVGRTAQGHRLYDSKALETARQVYAARVARHGLTGKRNRIAG